MINKNQAIRILNAGLKTGADYAEIYIEEKDSFGVSIENGKVESSAVNHSYGAGVRLLNKLQSVYGYTNEVNEKSLTKLIENLSNSFNQKQCIKVDNLVTKKPKNLSKVEQSFSTLDDNIIIDYLKEGEKILREYDKRVVRTQASFSYSVTKVQIATTKGTNYIDYKERGRIIDNSFCPPFRFGIKFVVVWFLVLKFLLYRLCMYGLHHILPKRHVRFALRNRRRKHWPFLNYQFPTRVLWCLL